MQYIARFVPGLALLLPAAAFAQNLSTLLGTVSEMLNALVYILITLALVTFFWGLIRYLASASSETKSSGLKTMLYGIVTIFVMVSIWGIIRLLQNTVGVTDIDKPEINLDARLNAPGLTE